ncbi:hypothetical protein KCU88_g245, partial [Aureobasidium melanogenum]
MTAHAPECSFRDCWLPCTIRTSSRRTRTTSNELEGEKYPLPPSGRNPSYCKGTFSAAFTCRMHCYHLHWFMQASTRRCWFPYLRFAMSLACHTPALCEGVVHKHHCKRTTLLRLRNMETLQVGSHVANGLLERHTSEQSSSRNPDREREGQRRDDHRKREEEEHDRDEYDHETRYDPEREQRLNDAYDNFKTEYVREQKFKYLWSEEGASADERTGSYGDRAGWSDPLERTLEDRVDRLACSDDNRRTMDANSENRIIARDFAYAADDRRSRTYEDPRRSTKKGKDELEGRDPMASSQSVSLAQASLTYSVVGHAALNKASSPSSQLPGSMNIIICYCSTLKGGGLVRHLRPEKALHFLPFYLNPSISNTYLGSNTKQPSDDILSMPIAEPRDA